MRRFLAVALGFLTVLTQPYASCFLPASRLHNGRPIDGLRSSRELGAAPVEAEAAEDLFDVPVDRTRRDDRFQDYATYEEKELRELEWLVKTTSMFLERDASSVPLTKGRISRIHLLMKAWARRSGRRGSNAPQLVERILHKLVEERDAGNDEIKIDTKLYNILLDSWSQSREDGAAERAEEILTRMETLCSQGCTDLRPDASSFNACIKAYVKSGDNEANCIKAEELLGRMESPSSGDESLQPNRRGYNLVLYALANTSQRNAAEKADAILEKMMAKFTNGNDHCRPDVNTFNQVLTCWARGRKPDYESHLQRRFDDLLELPETLNVEPNTDSFNAVMGGWLKSSSPDSLKHVLETLKLMEIYFKSGNHAASPDRVSVNSVTAALAKSGTNDAVDKAIALRRRMEKDYDIKPDTCSNNILVDIWCRSRRPDAPLRAMELLTAMERDFKRGRKDLKPDAYTYVSVINCFVKYGVPKAPEMAEQLLARMKELSRRHGGDQPPASVYNSVLNAWAGSRTPQAVERVNMLLQEMESSRNNGVPRPDKITYNTAIKAMSHGNLSMADKAEELLVAMEEKGLSDVYTYTAVIAAYGRSDSDDKAEKARSLLERMINSYNVGNSSAKPNTAAFNAALNACAFVEGDNETRREAFNLLVVIMGLLKQYTKPDHTTYGTVLRACSSLLPMGDGKRELVVDSIFRQACQEGLVGKLVIRQLRFAAPPKLYRDLTGRSIDLDAPLDLPHEWTCNVREKPNFRHRAGRR